ncbi:MAG: EAL domain-containing protein, partial [Lachnospiraceae bacterium]|nr:EAL domain-containing protein [Lachnospiraceae bacterium]
MSDSKDKRIKRLKKKRIWPSVLGLFIITIIFAILILFLISFACVDLVQRKLIEGNSRSEAIAGLFEAYEDGQEQRIQDAVLTNMEMESEVEAVWVADADGNKLWSNNDMAPDRENAFDFLWIDESAIRLIVEEDDGQVLQFHGNDIRINENFFSEMYKLTERDERTFFSIKKESAIMQIRVWFVQEINGLEVYVLQTVCVYGYDLVMFILCIELFGIMIAVFLLYYLISFISVIVSMRRTTKIIYTDMVTGGNNWLHFVKKGNSLLKRKVGARNYAVIHLKMRKYRSFCTCFGVKEGETLVEKMYHVLKKNIKRYEVMAHQENAKFGLMLAYTDEQQLLARIAAMENDLNAVLPKMKVYFAVGIYRVQQKERDIEQLYNNALLACDMLGEEAENQIAFFDVEMNKQRLWERKVEDDMDAALVNHEFQIYLQPKVSTTQEVLAGAEALVRWIHPTEGFIPPNKFIPIFERNGFILKLDDYMLEGIARQQALWINQGRKVVPISVNISRAHFAKEDLAEHICSIVDKYQVPHQFIELELTESAFFDDKNVLLQTVKKLRTAGFIVSMDDFGAGYSSLNSLKELQLDVLKLDADFFRGADVQERGLLIVSEVIDLAKK